MASRITAEQIRAAKVLVALAESEGQEPEAWTMSVANAVPAAEVDSTTSKVTADQVDNARLLVAIERARGHESEEWIVRLANARQA